jgi:hypothetical protein
MRSGAVNDYFEELKSLKNHQKDLVPGIKILFQS